MGRKIEVLGIKIDSYKIDEMEKLLNEYLNSDCLNTIEFISTELLLKAGENEELKAWIESMDLTVVREKAILTAAEIEDTGIIAEVENNRFMELMLNKAMKEGKTVFLLTETEENGKSFEEYMRKYYQSLIIVGSYVVENCWGDEDMIINEINIAAPDIILAAMSNPLQEQFINNHRVKLNAATWVGLGKNMRPMHEISLKPKRLSKLIDKTIFRRKVSKYKNDKGDA